MISDKLKQLTELKKRAAELEAQLETEQRKELAGLPAQFGFDSVNAFIAALRAATAGKRAQPKAVAKPAGGRRTRAVITDATRAEVKKLVGEGKTGAEIARTVGISLPSVQNIKEALGLVQKRKK